VTVSKLAGVIAGSALSVGGLALAPIDAAAQSRPSAPSTGLCRRLVGVGQHYTVVSFPCVLTNRFRHFAGEVVRIELR
jgi:hypothetical protein